MDGGPFAGSTTPSWGRLAGEDDDGLQFAIEGVKREEVMVVNFQENPAQLRRALTKLGYDPALAEAQGFSLMYASPVELQIDSIVSRIFETIRTGSVRRLIIDAVGDLAIAANDEQRLHDYLYALIQHFAVRGVTTMLTLESGAVGVPSWTNERFSYMSDNLIHLAWATRRRSPQNSCREDARRQ
jgi:KaiC/GvpD/RAD55 family RecA-like ATPase